MDEAPAVSRGEHRGVLKALGVALSAVLGLDLTFLAGSAWGRGRTLALVVAFTALTGYADSQGFVHASKLWDDGRLVSREMLLSGAGFLVGVVAYWIVVRLAGELGVHSALIQTLGWFAVTIAAVVLTDAGHHQWELFDTATAAVVVSGLGLLLYRTAG